MSEKKSIYDIDTSSLLRKKSSRKKKKVEKSEAVEKLNKDFDLKTFREKIFNELALERTPM